MKTVRSCDLLQLTDGINYLDINIISAYGQT